MILTLRVRPMLALVPLIFSFGAALPASAQQAGALAITTTPISSPTPTASQAAPTPVTVTATLTPDVSLVPSPTITATTGISLTPTDTVMLGVTATETISAALPVTRTTVATATTPTMASSPSALPTTAGTRAVATRATPTPAARRMSGAPDAAPSTFQPLSGYAYQVPVTVTGGSAAVGGSATTPVGMTSTDYVVKLHLTGAQAAAVYNTAFYNATTTDNGIAFADVTLWWTDAGGTAHQLDIDYDPSTYGAWSPSNITLWFRLQQPLGAAPATDASYTLAWGNQTPTVPRNWANIYPLQDDFAGTTLDGSKWSIGSVGKAGTVTVADSALTLRSPVNTSGGYYYLGSVHMFGPGYVVTARGRLPVTAAASEQLYFIGLTDGIGQSYMYAASSAATSASHWTGDGVVNGVGDGAPSIGPIDPGFRTYSVAHAPDGRFYVWRDGDIPARTSTGQSNIALSVSSNIGEGSNVVNDVIDWIKVRPWIATEPVVSVGVPATAPGGSPPSMPPLSSYAYQAPITVTGGSAAVGGSTVTPVSATSTDYVMKLHLTGAQAAAVYTTATYNASVTDDGVPFADVTLWWTDQGGTARQLDIDYDPSTYGAWSASNITLWFRLQQPLGVAPAADNTYTLAWGNATPAVRRDWANIYPLQDDFKGTTLDTSKWATASTGGSGDTITVANGVLTLHAPANAGGSYSLASTQSFGPGYVVTVRGRLPNTPDSSEILYLIGQTDVVGQNYMYAATNAALSTADWVGSGNLSGMPNGNPTIGPIDTDYRTYSVAHAPDGRFYVWRDGDTATSAGSDVANGALLVSTVMAQGNAPIGTIIDWVKVRPWIPGEPVASIGAVTIVPPVIPMSGVIPWHPHKTMRMADGLGTSIDLADGHVDVSASDMQLPGRGPDLAMDQTWDSSLAQGSVTTTAGQGWSSSLSPSIGGAITGTLTFTDDTGASWPLTYTGSLSADGPYTAYSPPPGMPWQLTVATAPTTAYTLTDFLTGATMSFDGQGHLATTGDAYGNENRLHVTGDPGPSSMVNDGGRSMRFLYGTNGLLSDVESPLWVSGGSGQAGSQHVAYGYVPGTSQLQTITTAAGTGQDLTTAFGYNGTQLLTITVPSGRQWALGYDALGRVSRVTSPQSGTVTTAPGYTPAYTTAFTYTPGQTVVVEGFGSPHPVTTTYALDKQGEPTTITDGTGHQTSATYDADHDVTSRTDANGNLTQYGYQYVGPPGASPALTTTGLLTQTISPPVAAYTTTNSLAPVVTTYAYNPGTDDLAEVDLPQGGRTFYGYDGAHHTVITTTQLLKDTPGFGCPQVAQRGPTVSAARAAALPPSCAQSYTWRATVTQRNGVGQVVARVDARGVDVPQTTSLTPPAAVLSASAALYTSSYGYDAQGDLTSASTPPITTTADADAPVTTVYTPDADGNVTSVQSPNGNVTSYVYDHLGRVTMTTAPPVALSDGTTGSPSTSVTYDPDGNLATTRDALGDTVARSYDPLGRMTTLTNALGRTALMTYTATQLVATQDFTGDVSSIAYDRADRPSAATDPLGVRTLSSYDPVGNTTAITTPLDYTNVATVTLQTAGYDALNRPVTQTVQGGMSDLTPPYTTTISYDSDGNVALQAASGGTMIASQYDLADRLLTTAVYTDATDSPVAARGVAFDAADNIATSTDFNERAYAANYDGDNRLAWATACLMPCPSASPITTSLAYDPDGNTRVLTRTVGAAAPVVSRATYNAADWLTSQDDGQGPTSYGYDAAGRLQAQTLLGGTGIVTDTLNADGLATGIGDAVTQPVPPPPTGTPPPNTLTPPQTATPMGTGTASPTAASSPTPTSTVVPLTTTLGASSFGYDLDDRPLTATLGLGAAMLQETRAYTAGSELQSLQVTGPATASAVNYGEQDSYDPQGHTALIALQSGSSAPTVEQFSYTPLGQLSTLQQRPRAYNGSGTSYTWSYDGAGNLRSRAMQTTQPFSPPSTTSAVYRYSFDSGVVMPGGSLPNELTSTDDGTSHVTYGYDGRGDTTAITVTASIHIQPNARPRPTPTPTAPAHGSRKSKTARVALIRTAATTPSGTTRLSYDAGGLLQGVTLPDGTQITQGYNARGLRASYVVQPGGAQTPSLIETLLYRGDRVGQVAVNMAGQVFTDTLLYRQDGAPLELLYQPQGGLVQRYWYVLDGQGSVVALADATGSVVDSYSYDPWGATTGSVTVPQPLGYRGAWDDGWAGGPLGWYWLGGRSYDPSLERFLQPNPDSANGERAYSYAGDNPIDGCDGGCASWQRRSDPLPGVSYDPGKMPGSSGNGFLAQVVQLAMVFLPGPKGEMIPVDRPLLAAPEGPAGYLSAPEAKVEPITDPRRLLGPAPRYTYTIRQIMNMPANNTRAAAARRLIEEQQGGLPFEVTVDVGQLAGTTTGEDFSGLPLRRFDVVAPGYGGTIELNEVKAYKPYLSRPDPVTNIPTTYRNAVNLDNVIEDEVTRDYMMRSLPNSVYRPVWRFLGAGPSADLAAALNENGIPTVIYHE